MIYSLPDFFHKLLLLADGFRLCLGLTLYLLSSLFLATLHLLEGEVIREDVVLLSLDDRIHYVFGMVALLDQHAGDDLHDVWFEGWESHENLLDDLVCNHF